MNDPPTPREQSTGPSAASRYDVHIYAIARVLVRGIVAPSPAEAARRAEALTDLEQRIASGGAIYAGEIDGCLVDVLDGEGQRLTGRSQYIKACDIPPAPPS